MGKAARSTKQNVLQTTSSRLTQARRHHSIPKRTNAGGRRRTYVHPGLGSNRGAREGHREAKFRQQAKLNYRKNAGRSDRPPPRARTDPSHGEEREGGATPSLSAN